MGREPAQRPLPDIVTRTRNPIQRAFHALVSLGGWILFAWFWWTIFARPMDRSALYTFGLLLLALVAIVGIHLLWVRFNLDFYRTRGQRTRVHEVEFLATEDRLGRRLSGGDWDVLRSASSIELSLDPQSETKTYRVVDPLPSHDAGKTA